MLNEFTTSLPIGLPLYSISNIDQGKLFIRIETVGFIICTFFDGSGRNSLGNAINSIVCISSIFLVIVNHAPDTFLILPPGDCALAITLFKAITNIDMVDQPSKVRKILRLVNSISVKVSIKGSKDIHHVLSTANDTSIVNAPSRNSD